MQRARGAFSAAIGLGILVLLFGIMSLSAQGRVDEPSPRTDATVPAPTPDYPIDPTPDDGNLIMPPPQAELLCELAAGPERFCPGWNLWYELSITNVGRLPVTNLTISDTLPAGVWTAVEGYQGTVIGHYDETTRTMSWRIDTLQVGETAVISCVLRTSSTVADGVLLENTFTGLGFGMDEPLSISQALRADRSICQQSATPTVEPTPVGYVPTPEPPVYSVCLPVIVQ